MSSNAVNASDSVFGHYVQQGHLWEPLLSESSPLFRAIVNDDARTLEAELDLDTSKANQFFVLLYWGSRPTSPEASVQTPPEDGSKPAVTVKQRTLLMIAAFHGSMRVLALLAVNGADPAIVSPDGLTAYQLAYSSQRPEAATVVAYLRDAEQSLQVLRGQLDASGKMGLASGGGGGGQLTLDSLPAGGVDLSNPQMRNMWNIPANGSKGGGGDSFSQDSLPYSTAELTKPEYSTDEFRMFCFKILRCCRRYAHDWRACPFAHPTENARRRDPREFKYCSLPCPDYKQGFCLRGDNCSYAHGVFECWLHPSKFRTQLCKDGNKCRRPVCFFAHSLTELRSPTHTWTPSPDALKNTPPPPHLQEKEDQPSGTVLGPRESSEEFNDSAELTNPVLQKQQDFENGNSGPDLPPTMPPLKTADSSQTLSSLERSTSQEALLSAASGGSFSKKVQAAKSSGYTPRMSNAFARKHGLDPKDGPVLNYQKLSGRQGVESRPASAFDRRSQSFDSRTATTFVRSASSRQRRMRQANHSALESLNFSMNAINFGSGGGVTRPGSSRSLNDPSSFALAAAGASPQPHAPEPMSDFGRVGGLHHSHSTGEHLRSHSAMLPDLTGSLDSSFQLLHTTPSLSNASSFLGLQNYVLGHSMSYTPGSSFSGPIPAPDGRTVPPPPPPLSPYHPMDLITNAEMNYQHQAAVNAMGQNSENSGATT